jgi:hypothetical protein
MKRFFMVVALAAAITCAVVAMRRRGCCRGDDAWNGDAGCSCGCE